MVIRNKISLAPKIFVLNVYKAQFRLWTVPYPVGHMTSAEYLSTSWVQSFQLFPSEWELCSYWVILISLQSLQRPDCTSDVLYVDRSPAPDPVDSKLSLPSRVRQSDGLGQGTLPGTFDCWRVFWSIASPLLKKNMKKWITISQISTEASCFWKGDTVLPKLWQVVLCAVTHGGNSEH